MTLKFAGLSISGKTMAGFYHNGKRDGIFHDSRVFGYANIFKPWDSWGSIWPITEVDGHSIRVGRSEKQNNWSAKRTTPYVYPAGTYSIKVDGGTNLAFEFHKGGKVVTYLNSEWKTFAITEPTELYVQLAMPPNWTGDVWCTPILVEGDWGGAGSELSLPDNLWQQENFAVQSDIWSAAQTGGLLTITVNRDMTEADRWMGKSLKAVTLSKPTWTAWTPESNTGTDATTPDFTDHTKYATNPNNKETRRLLPAGTYDECVSLHLSKAGTYTCRPYLYEIPFI